MHMSEIDLNDLNNPHLSEINGVRMDKRFLGDRVKGTLAYWMKENLHVARYCPECYTISRSLYEHDKHFTRRVHLTFERKVLSQKIEINVEDITQLKR